MTIYRYTFWALIVAGFVCQPQLLKAQKSDLAGRPLKAATSIHDNPVNELGQKWQAFVEARVANDEFSGAILFAKGDRVVVSGAYGLASKRFDIANNIDTKFNLGSMNKMFTGVAICQLYEQGKLLFDDPVIKHLPDYPNRGIAERVTIHQLLTHTSGLGTYWNRKYDERYSQLRTLADYLPIFADDPLAFEPGSDFLYSNVGPVVLGLIIERISGQSYYAYVRQNIFQPAGMLDTDCFDLDIPVPNLAMGYSRIDLDKENPDNTFGIPWRNNLYTHTVKGGPAGGGFSTVGDLHRFAKALQNDILLKPETRHLLISGKVELGPGFQQAYLFVDDTDTGFHRHGHNGGAAGVSADFGYYPELDLTYVVLSNYDLAAGPVGKKLNQLVREFFGSGSSPPPKYRLGLAFMNLNDQFSVAEVFPNTPAESAGFEVHDVILSINGDDVGTDPLVQLDRALNSGQELVFGVSREGLKMKLVVKPEKIK